MSPAVLALVAAVVTAVPITELANAPCALKVLATEPPLARECAFEPAPSGGRLRCRPSVPVRLRLACAAYEPRWVEVPAGASRLDLAEGWVPTPVQVEVGTDFGEVWGVWLGEAGELEWARAVDGVLAGPRVAPGGRLQLALVGPGVRPASVDAVREATDAPVRVRLQPGASKAVVCRDPWSRQPAPCHLRLGTLSKRTVARLGTPLVPRGDVSSLGAIRPLDVRGQPEWLLAEAPGLPVAAHRVAELPEVSEVVFEPPRELHVRLEDAERRTRLSGRVRVFVPVGDRQLTLVETDVPEEGVDLLLAPGGCELQADAPGFRPARAPCEADPRRRELVLRLERGARAAGRVIDPTGQPVPGTVVVALPAPGSSDPGSDSAPVEADGSFAVSLPGAGPWRVLARREGYGVASAELSTPATQLTLVLVPACEVAILPLGSDGAPLETAVLAFVRVGSLEAVVSTERDADGAFRARLAPGEWLVAVEQPPMRGIVSVPEACAGFRASVALRPAAVTPP